MLPAPTLRRLAGWGQSVKQHQPRDLNHIFLSPQREINASPSLYAVYVFPCGTYVP